jgi:hypothetical protein
MHSACGLQPVMCGCAAVECGRCALLPSPARAGRGALAGRPSRKRAGKPALAGRAARAAELAACLPAHRQTLRSSSIRESELVRVARYALKRSRSHAGPPAQPTQAPSPYARPDPPARGLAAVRALVHHAAIGQSSTPSSARALPCAHLDIAQSSWCRGRRCAVPGRIKGWRLKGCCGRRSVATRAPWRVSSHATVSSSRHLLERRVGPRAGPLAVSYAGAASAAAFQVCPRARARDDIPAGRHRASPDATRPERTSPERTSPEQNSPERTAAARKRPTAKAPSSPSGSAAATRRCLPPAAIASLPSTLARGCPAPRSRRSGSCGPRRQSARRRPRCWPSPA